MPTDTIACATCVRVIIKYDFVVTVVIRWLQEKKGKTTNSPFQTTWFWYATFFFHFLTSE